MVILTKMKAKFFDKDDGGSGEIPNRDQVQISDTWDLTQLFLAPKDWLVSYEKVQGDYLAISQWRGRVGESATTLRAVLEFERDLSLQIERLGHYASLLTSGDSANAEHLAREAQLENLLTRIGEATAFVGPEIQAIDDLTFAALLKDEYLAEWWGTLRKQRRFRPHTLTANEERLLALGSSALRGHGETFSQLTDVDLVFGKLTDENGVVRELSQSSYSSFLVRRDPSVRQCAFQTFYAEFDAHKFTLASTLANSVKADVFYARARNYSSAREAALFADDIPVGVYDNLIKTVREHLPALHRYYALRRRLLGLKEIHQFDTYVPIVDKVATDLSWDGACDQVLAALQPLGEEYVSTLEGGLRGRWCDRYENKGKRSGAFSSSSYGNPPFILMNYQRDVFSDVYTLAHEAGHSMHTWYAQRTQSYQDYHYPIFLAEVASTFNEELLTHHLLAATSDRRMRAYLVNRQIDDLRGTLYRQTMFAEFEKIVHAMEEAGEPLTLESFRSTYRGLLDAYFGPEFVIDRELELECLRIPHFYRGFYVYKYATGISAAVALSQKVLAGGSVDRYLNFLRSGGVEMPLPTLVAAGVDMSTSDPIASALNLFSQRVSELEELLSE